MPSNLTLPARKILSKWSAQDFYVYLRPISSVYINPSNKHTTYWVVSVEFRTVDYVQVRGEGYDLSQVIIDLDAKVPNRRKVQPGYQTGRPGWLAAQAMTKKQKRRRRARKS